MLKKLDILGLELDNYTVREAMLRAETYLNNNEMNTIETISMSMLEKAGHDEKMRACLKNLDLAVIGEKEILLAAGVNSTQRMKETIENTFFYEFMKRLLRNKKTIYLLGEKETDVKNEKIRGNFYTHVNYIFRFTLNNISKFQIVLGGHNVKYQFVNIDQSVDCCSTFNETYYPEEGGAFIDNVI